MILLVFITLIQCKVKQPATTKTMLEGKWQLTGTQLVSRGIKPSDVPAEVPDQQLIFKESEVLIIESGKPETSFSYEIQEMKFQEEPMRYIMISKKLRGEVHFYGSDSLSIGDKGSCSMITHYKRVE